MKYRTLIGTLLFVGTINLHGQVLKKYIEQNAQSINIEEFKLNPEDDFQNNDLVFFGFIHGSSTPQIVDYRLLQHLAENYGYRYYVPEVDPSQAYFLNQYLKTGNIEFLDFIIFFYEKRIPQDASIEFRDKWKKIFLLNQSFPEKRKIKIIGTDIPSSDKRLAITHLAYLLDGKETGDPMIDSLRVFKSTEIDDRKIWSGAPAASKVKQLGGFTYDYVYPVDSKYNFANRFLKYYDKNKGEVKKLLERNNIDISEILDKKSKSREEHIFLNFQKQVIPIIQSGGKVYANFGAAHIYQKEIYGNCYVACKIKNEYPNLRLKSILGLLANSTVLKERKWKKSKESIVERGVSFDGMTYSGFKTSTTWDGHSMFEKLDGIDQLIRINRSKNISFLNLDNSNSPFKNRPYLVSYKKGGKNMKIDPSSNTLEYFQYVILMKNSVSNTPIQSLSSRLKQ